jgi:hypothetical protein
MRNAFSNWDFKADRLLFPVSSPHLSLLVMELLHRYSGLSSGSSPSVMIGLVNRDRRAIHEKTETEPKI